MPTATERASLEADRWRGIAGRWTPEIVPDLYEELAPSEHAVVAFYDPVDDLDRRGAEWGFVLERSHLDELSRFTAELSHTEAQAWSDEVPDLAMRAYEARRLLIGDRIAHWAVPWLDAVGRGHRDLSDDAFRDRDAILEFGDEMRFAPALTGSEGLTVPGEDSFGPIAIDVPFDRHVRSVWSGLVLLGPGMDDEALRAEYRKAAQRWRSLAEDHPGSAALWLDLGERADRTTAALGGHKANG